MALTKEHDLDAVAAQRALFRDPPREFGLFPFWAWNDDLDDDTLLAQIRAMHAGGFGGFVPHVDLGLSRRIGYLTDEFFRLMHLCVDEAKRLGMQVILYDEGYYPSGSAQGRVVAENPAYAARCLFRVETRITGPAAGYWRPNPGRALCDELVCVVAARETGPDAVDPASLTLLEADERGLVRYSLPEGAWRLTACWTGFSGGTIRGVFAEEDDGHALAPAAADLMNPDAVATFLRLTHDAYYRHLGEHFGQTIVAMFTDEPDPLGRAPRRARGGDRGARVWAYTPGLLDEVAWEDDVLRWLPALWLDAGERTEAFRQAYVRAVHQRVARVYYSMQAEWCEAHGIALTGHPGASNEMEGLRAFQWPGQDMVWRYVEPARPESALQGPHSTAPRVAASAAALAGRRRNLSELFGAYGWRTTLDETKWLYDWHLSRGTNLFVPGSVFYSMRGRRAFNSEPAIGPHNVWWPYYRAVADHVRRLCWLLSDGLEVCDVAVLTHSEAASWVAAQALYREQIGFLYVDDAAMATATVAEGALHIGPQTFRAVVCDPPDCADGTSAAVLREFEEQGGRVIRQWAGEDLAEQLTLHLGRDVDWPGAPDLRALHYHRAGLECYLLWNEGEQPLEGRLSLGVIGAVEVWDPQRGATLPWPAAPRNGRLSLRLRLERREALVAVVDPARAPDASLPTPPVAGEVVASVDGPWRVTDLDGQPVAAPAPGDWARAKGLETFTGTLVYHTTFDLPAALRGGPVFLDLGAVGDIAEVLVNGQPAGARGWAPYVLEIGALCRARENALDVRVTNSMANAYDGLQLPSGLLGEVTLRGPRSLGRP